MNCDDWHDDWHGASAIRHEQRFNQGEGGYSENSDWPLAGRPVAPNLN